MQTNANTQDDGFLRLPEASSLCGVAPRTFENWIKDGIVPFYRVGKRLRLFKREELVAMMERHRVASRAEVIS